MFLSDMPAAKTQYRLLMEQQVKEVEDIEMGLINTENELSKRKTKCPKAWQNK